jgi:hypothetical protein
MSEPRYSDDDLKRVAGIKDEQFDDHLKAVLEGVDAILDKRLKPMERDLAELNGNVKIVKAAATDTSRDMRTLDERVDRLEANT